MPTPPTVTIDYVKVGGPLLMLPLSWAPSWGALRYPFPLSSETETTTIDVSTNGFSTEYDRGFLASDGSLFPFETGWWSGSEPAYIIYGNRPGPPLEGIFLFDNGVSYTGIGPFMDNDVRAQLTGETVTMTSGSFNITADSYTNPPGLQVEAPNLGDFVSIGKLWKV